MGSRASPSSSKICPWAPSTTLHRLRCWPSWFQEHCRVRYHIRLCCLFGYILPAFGTSLSRDHIQASNASTLCILHLQRPSSLCWNRNSRHYDVSPSSGMQREDISVNKHSLGINSILFTSDFGNCTTNKFCCATGGKISVIHDRIDHFIDSVDGCGVECTLQIGGGPFYAELVGEKSIFGDAAANVRSATSKPKQRKYEKGNYKSNAEL